MLYYIFFFIILMNLILKQLCIIIGVFSITLWVQDMDDKKYNKTRSDVFDKYKFPLLMSAIIGFLINIPEIIMKSNTNNEIPVSFINSIRPNAELGSPTKQTLEALPYVKQRLSRMNDSIIEPLDLTRAKFDKPFREQQIYTSLPDF